MLEEKIHSIMEKYQIMEEDTKEKDPEIQIELIYQKFSSNFYHTLEEEYEIVDLFLQYHEYKQNTKKAKYTDIARRLQEENIDIQNKNCPLLDPSFYEWILRNKDKVNETFDNIVAHTPSKKYDLFGWKTLYKSYLLRTHQGVIESPDHLWYRIALFVHQDDWTSIETMFTDLRQGNYIHATPSLFSAGSKHPQMASCFLLGVQDSVEGIYNTIKDCALISKWAGGIGVHLSNIRGKNSYINGTNGRSNGIMPLLKVLNDTARYIDQCFDKDTLVLTDRGFLPIHKIEIERDKVWTLQGTYQTVKKKLIHKVPKEDIYKVRHKTFWGNEYSTRMTLTHDVYWKSISGEYVWEPIANAGKGWLTCYVTPPRNEEDERRWNDSEEIKEDFFILGYIYRYIKKDPFSSSVVYSQDEEITKGLKVFFHKYSIPYTYNDENQMYELECLGIWEKWFSCHPQLPYPSLSKLPSLCLEYFFYGWTCRIDTLLTTEIQDPEMMWFLYYWKRDVPFHYGEIISIEQEKNDVSEYEDMYDLEIETESNYQTLLGLVHNGGGKRNGAFSVYIEPWHCDIYSFLYAKKNVGAEEERARDLFYALWIPDYFMHCVEKDQEWYLMSPDECPGLHQTWGNYFVELYTSYIEKGSYRKKIMARELWIEILKIQIETGTPYLLYKDQINRCSNQNHLGTLCSSNLCCEIMEYSNEDEYAVCNLASISLPSCLQYPQEQETFILFGKSNCFYCKVLLSFLQERDWKRYEYYDEQTLSSYRNWIRPNTTYPQIFLENGTWIGGFHEFWEQYLCPRFDFDKLRRLTQNIVQNINKIIDKTYYPMKSCETSNLKNRPMGIGVQGLADVYFAMLLPYTSDKARDLNAQIFESMYYFALEESMELSKEFDSFYSFPHCQLSKGIFHFELYDRQRPLFIPLEKWNQLRESIQLYGTRNSLFLALMPTASTSQILGNTESFEPLTNNFYLRRTSAGEFYVINRYLKKLLMGTGLWNPSLVESILIHKGSIQHLDMLPTSIREVFQTVWELSTKDLIDSAHDRQCFIDQSQSFNIYLNQPSTVLLNKIHFYGWKQKLKTGSYYIRSKAPISSQPIALSTTPVDCVSCSS
jgi:ribonucleoside-diphosphate reductase alpha subunit